MKNVLLKVVLGQRLPTRTAGLLALLPICFLILVGCGGANPKDLAKQSYEISRQVLAAAFDSKETEKLAGKAAAIEQKVAKLSASDKAIYAKELARLAGNDLDELSDNISDMAGNAQKALDAA
jgi:hypothetical protein